MDTTLENPTGVINSMQSRIDALVEQLAATERLLEEERLKPVPVTPALRRLRLFGVMTLYVGEGGRDHLEQQLAKHSPELLDCLDAFWYLENAPVSDQAMHEFGMFAKAGMFKF